jgi:undecaprenyl-diphosphatase
MALLRISPLLLDRRVADFVCEKTNPELEAIARVLTWGADEHLLLAAAGIIWLVTRTSPSGARRRIGAHLLALSVVTSVLPHVLKAGFDQKRPDRETVAAHRKGVPFSGKANDAFPSGHAIHMGALASAATLFPRSYRNAMWSIAGTLSITRVVILAHWMTDVAIGFALGIGIERLLRRVTKPTQLSEER